MPAQRIQSALAPDRRPQWAQLGAQWRSIAGTRSALEVLSWRSCHGLLRRGRLNGLLRRGRLNGLLRRARLNGLLRRGRLNGLLVVRRFRLSSLRFFCCFVRRLLDLARVKLLSRVVAWGQGTAGWLRARARARA